MKKKKKTKKKKQNKKTEIVLSPKSDICIYYVFVYNSNLSVPTNRAATQTILILFKQSMQVSICRLIPKLVYVEAYPRNFK